MKTTMAGKSKFFVIVGLLLIIICFSACGNNKNNYYEPSENIDNTTEKYYAGYSVSEIENAVISAFKQNDASMLDRYLIPKAEETLDYIRSSFDEDSSVILDIHTMLPEEYFEYSKDDDINLEELIHCYKEDITYFSRMSSDDKEDYIIFLNEISDSLNSVGFKHEISDFAFLDIALEDETFGSSVGILLVQVENTGWYIFGIDP